MNKLKVALRLLPLVMLGTQLIFIALAQDWHWFGYQQAPSGYSGLYSCRPV